MLAFPRPPKPANFDAHTKKARDKIEAIVAAGEDLKSKQFDSRWSAFRVTFANTQCRKCGYCEDQPRTEYGAVEHYAPKSRIQRIQCERHGRDAEGLTLTHELNPHRAQGYYWRAYDWDNYLFACTLCNTRHKRDLFPVVDNADDDPRFPAPDIPVEPLLLHPFEPGLEPHAHLGFDFEGAIFARNGDPRGRETIRSCRLDRHGLTLPRRTVARQVEECIRELAERFENAGPKVAKRLLKLGAEDQPFAGMVRILVRQELSLSWGELCVYAGDTSPTSPSCAT